jgi:ArsR family transcriptional regulator
MLPGMSIAEDVVRVGKALSDPTRVRLLVCLAERELCVCELVHLVDVGQPAVSRHLRILREAGLVEDVRDGQFVNYRLRRPAQTPFGDAALGALLGSYPSDEALRGVAQRALVVSRACL